MSLKMILFWLIVGNYAYQFFGDQSWTIAFERSYFQALALGGVWFTHLMSPADRDPPASGQKSIT